MINMVTMDIMMKFGIQKSHKREQMEGTILSPKIEV